ncbi:MAG: efflux RND transporter periplasmic adaptor subunit [Devosia sp.]|nr:efflux RND transporter periplasmic adaptor subunit [Devosia sp.]
MPTIVRAPGAEEARTKKAAVGCTKSVSPLVTAEHDSLGGALESSDFASGSSKKRPQWITRALRFVGRILREVIWIVIAVALVYGGFQGFRFLGDSRPVIEVAPVERPITLVETAELAPITGPLPVRGQGFVVPYRRVALSALSGGRIVELHPALVDRRGQFSEGDVLVRLDGSAERASLEQIASSIKATEARLDLNRTQLGRIQALRDSGSASQGTLDELTAQNAELAANLEGFRAALVLGQIALENRSVVAPFDGAVLTKSAEVGSVVGAGQSIAEIYTSGQLDVDIAIREADASLIPGLFDGAKVPASVSIVFAGREINWHADITRVAPDLDPQTRTLTVTVEISDVAGGRTDDENQLISGAPPALINAFARVVISGDQPAATYPVPSTALRNGQSVWVTQGGVLRILPARLVHVDGETSYVTIDELPQGARLILTALASPVEGMELRDLTGASTAAMTE